MDKGMIRTMEWATDAGQVVLSYPENMPPHDIDDVEALFALTIRILRRRGFHAAADAKARQRVEEVIPHMGLI